MLLDPASFQQMELTHFVEFGRLRSGISHRNTPPGHFVASLKLVFGVSALTDSHQELTGFTANRAPQAQHVAEVAMALLVEGPHEPDAGLY